MNQANKVLLNKHPQGPNLMNRYRGIICNLAHRLFLYESVILNSDGLLETIYFLN